RLVDNLAPSLAAADKAYAVGVLTAELNAGANRGMVAYSAIKALAAVPEDDANFGAAAAALNNKVEVATYYTIDKLQSGASLAELQDVIADVTADEATVTEAKADIDGVVDAGQTLVLTQGLDTLTGTTLNDTFN